MLTFSDHQLASDDVFTPVEPANGFRYPALDFVPGPLRILSLSALIICCLFMIIALAFCNIWSLRHNGLWQYDGVVTGRYFVFQFLPQILGSILIIWLLVIQSAMHRIFPFIALASGWSPRTSDILHHVALFPTTFLIPNFAFFRHAEPLLGVCSIIFWLTLFTVPLQACLFQTRYYAVDAENVWRWTSVQPIGWILFVLYLLMMMALVLLLIRFSGRLTGLKWDAASIADIMVLIHKSNILADFVGEEKIQKSKEYRLGYWRTTNLPSDPFHSLGEVNGKVHRYSGSDTANAETVEEKQRNPAKADLEAQRQHNNDACEPDFEARADRYRFVPWFLKETYVVAWFVTAIVLLIAFIAVSFVHHAVQQGFLPLLPAPTTSYAFSPADFLYSFLPSLIGMILFLLFQPFDLTFRALQPFAHLAHINGATAEQSLLSDYTSTLPFIITIKALLAGHWKVAWLSFMSLVSITLPILAGGVFTAQFFVKTQDIRIAAHMPAYDALVFFCVLYAISFAFIWPGRKRHLPHDFRTLGQIISFVYRSRMLRDKAFSGPLSRTDLVTRLMAEGQAGRRYVFGMEEGAVGRRYMGIDYLERSEREERDRMV